MARIGRFIQGFLGRGWVDPVETPPAPPKPAVRDNEVDVLQFDGKDIRTIWLKGEQWWVAADVCGAIEIVNASDALKGLDDDEKATIANPDSRPGEPGAKFLSIVNEPGLYHLLSKSNKFKAKKFWRWVRHDVLPSIRQTGSFSIDQTPIRPWIRKTARKLGFSPAWQKKRQKIADGNKAADAGTFAIGGNAMACSNRYNRLYFGLFRRVASQLKKILGCRDKDSPLNQMGDLPLSLYDTAHGIVLQKMKDGLITIDSLPEEAEKAGEATRKMALGQFPPGYDFDAVEDQKGNKILDTVHKQLEK